MVYLSSCFHHTHDGCFNLRAAVLINFGPGLLLLLFRLLMKFHMCENNRRGVALPRLTSVRRTFLDEIVCTRMRMEREVKLSLIENVSSSANSGPFVPFLSILTLPSASVRRLRSKASSGISVSSLISFTVRELLALKRWRITI
mmetsp:Transcript_9019/g.18212  ORF Transcript_9019/g.18212 Transcript_9019/m.18212 type:complete len:144 (-) Transcript_9019:921-1352(-)